jgi:hypothetical protein
LRHLVTPPLALPSRPASRCRRTRSRPC